MQKKIIEAVPLIVVIVLPIQSRYNIYLFHKRDLEHLTTNLLSTLYNVPNKVPLPLYRVLIPFRSEYDQGVNTFSPEGRIHQLEYALEASKV